MLPQSSIAVAVYARVVLPYIEKKQADTVTGLVVVVLGFYVPQTAKVIRRRVQDW